MNELSQAEGLLFYVRRVIVLTFIAGLVVVIGLPIPEATAQVPQILRKVDKSCPYVDPNTAPARIEELKARLAERRKAIEKTKSMLPGLHEGSREAWAKTDRIMNEAPAKLITSFAGDYLDKTKIMKDSITKLKNASGISPEKLKNIDSWLKTVEDLKEAGSFLKQAPTSFAAGKKFGLDHQAEMTSLREKLVSANDLFVDSGLAEELGGTFATAIGGPLGKLAFDASLTSINLIVASQEAFIEAGAARRVQSAIDTMEWAYGIDYSEMVNLTALLASTCGQEPRERVAASDRLPEPPPPPPPSAAEEVPVATGPVRPVSGPSMGTILLIGGGAAAAGMAAIALGTLGTTGADCGSPPQGFGNSWWYNEYVPWCECMGGTPVVSTNQCIQ